MKYKVVYYYEKEFGWIIDIIDTYNNDELVERIYFGMKKQNKQECENEALKILKQYN